MGGARVRFELNGRPVEAEVAPGESLLECLRERLHVTSPKNGCAPQGQCGACFALVDGQPKATCMIAASHVAGHRVTTLEGVPEADRALLARSFAGAGASQCGFCVPGIALHALSLVGREPPPTRPEVALALDAHLCRCTGYVKILDGVERFLAAKRGGVAIPARDPLAPGGVGARAQRRDAEASVLGARPYVDDLRFPGLIHGALVLTPHARCRILGIDATAALALPGVLRVVTAADVPGERLQGLLERDWPVLVAVGETTHAVGDVLAVVAAEDLRTARQAAALVKVDLEALAPVTDPEAALLPGAPRVHEGRPNLLSRSVIRRGDAAAALAASAHVVSGTWRTQRIEHAFLEPEACVAVPLEGGRLQLYSQSQGIFDDRAQVARALGLPEESVLVELVPAGGAFGGKEDLSVQAHAALLAHLLGRPAKVLLSREESVRIHPKRHPMTLAYTVGCDADGRLTAVQARIVGDSGAYASVGAKVLERAAGHACGAYRCENVDVEALAVYTNNPPCGAMRGFGVPQATFAIEGALDLLAAKVGVDALEIRLRNALRNGDRTTTGQRLQAGVGLLRTLEAVRPRYEEARRLGKPAGLACGIKNSGIGNGIAEAGRARLVVEGDGSISVYNGFTEMGQGLSTVLCQIAAEVTGLPLALFRARTDTTFQLGCGQTTGSRATFFGGRAVQAAAARLRAELDAAMRVGAGVAESLDGLVGRGFDGVVIDRSTTPLGADVPEPKTHPSYGFATQLVVLDREGRLERVVAAHDVGRAINPTLCEGQVEGAVHMGLGYALTEELPCDDEGWPVTDRMRELGILRARDMPPVEVILVEEPDPDGPFGAKGIGEIGLVPTAAAVAGALAAHDGVRRMALPMKDSPAARALHGVQPRAHEELWHHRTLHAHAPGDAIGDAHEPAWHPHAAGHGAGEGKP